MVLGLRKIGKGISGLGRRIERNVSGLGSRVERTAEGLGRKIVSSVGKAERIADVALKQAQPVLTGARQAARIGSQIAGAIPGGAGISAGLELGAQGLGRAADMSKQFRRENLRGQLSNVAGAAVGRGLEKFGERRKAIEEASRSVSSGFM